jgi:hypothetical protein
MKKTKSNISMFDIFSLTQQHDIFHDAFKADTSQKKIMAVTDNIPKIVGAK